MNNITYFSQARKLAKNKQAKNTVEKKFVSKNNRGKQTMQGTGEILLAFINILKQG